MATLRPLAVSGTTITASFDLNPGSPAVTADVTVYLDGAAKGTASGIQVTPAVPPETTPTVLIGATNSGWEIRTTSGVLRPGASTNTFVLSAS